MSPANGRLRSRAWAFQMGRSQMTESGSTATPIKKKKEPILDLHVLVPDVPLLAQHHAVVVAATLRKSP